MTFQPHVGSNPLPGFNFAVSFAESALPSGAIAAGGVTRISAGFQEVTGLESSLEIYDYKEGGRNEFTHKFATNATFGNITFKRGAALTPDLFQWYNNVRNGSFGARRSIMVAQLDYDRNVGLVWYLERALPAKYVGPSWNSGQSSVAIESLEVVPEGIRLLPASDFGLQEVAEGTS